MNKIAVLCCCLAVSVPAAPAAAAAAQPLPVEAFIAPDAFADIRISPDGRHLAASVPQADRSLLVMLGTDDLKQVGALAFKEHVYLNRLEWANPRQIIYSVESRYNAEDGLKEIDKLYRVNVDGSDAKSLQTHEDLLIQLLDTLRDDDDYVLVRFHLGGVARIHLDKQRRIVTRGMSPLDTPMYMTDNAGQIRFAKGYFGFRGLPRHDLRVDDEWVTINDEAATGRAMRVLGYTGDNRHAYISVQETRGADGLYLLDVNTRERKRLFEDERVDPADVVVSPEDGAVIAVRYFDGRPLLRYPLPEHQLALELQKLERAFKGQSVWPTSYTRDGGKGVYLVSSDVNSGEYYLVDHATGQARFIAAANDVLVPEAMSPMRAVRFKARDGSEIEAFLTVPASWPVGKPGPMVVMPHGGPRGEADRWQFDREVQMLASRGYAVLQPNFRGSSNYGGAFHKLGEGQWGGRMLDDIIDATRWAVAQGVTQPGRVCLYGFGYGGYAALMAPVREPGLYACSIGEAGYYDLGMMYRYETHTHTHRKAYLDELLGGDDIEKASPAGRAASLRIPVLIGAGKHDQEVPVDQARGMRRALRSAGVPVEVAIYDDEGHGIFLAKNRLDWARRVLALLDRTIGGKAATAAASE